MSKIWSAIKFGWGAYKALKTSNPELIEKAAEAVKNIIGKIAK